MLKQNLNLCFKLFIGKKKQFLNLCFLHFGSFAKKLFVIAAKKVVLTLQMPVEQFLTNREQKIKPTLVEVFFCRKLGLLITETVLKKNARKSLFFTVNSPNAQKKFFKLFFLITVFCS